MRIARLTRWTLLLAAVAHVVLADDAVAWDSSGNSLLNGKYNFREVTWGSKGDTHRIAIYGSIQFDGNGGYTLTSQVMDSNVGSVQSFSTQGAYRIAASGMGFMDDPNRLNAGSATSTIWGLVAQGIFVGSSTDDGINNLFIATAGPFAFPGNPNPNDSFKGRYWAAAVNIPSGAVTEARDMQFPLVADGQGGLGVVNLTGRVGVNLAPVTQTVNNATYSVANDTLTLSFGGSGPLNSQTLIAGTAICYQSTNGDFFFGGSPTGWDMIVGVRATANTTFPANAFTGMYFQAGADVTPSKGFQTLSTYYGAFSALGDSGTLIGHQRILPGDPTTNFKPYDFTYSDKITLAPDGTYDDSFHFHHVTGTPSTSVPISGYIQIGVGNASHVGINVAVRGPFHAPSGVYLDPYGIANAASSAPFSVGVSRGGIIALYGNNLASTTAVDNSMPTTLGNVQVLINGRPAPLYFVRSDVVLAIVPFATTGSVASVQVVNNGVPSAIRTVRIKDGTPGLFTNPAGGVGYAIAQHTKNNSTDLVTPQNPARPGEVVLVYLTGLGDVSPAVADGVPGPSNPPSAATHPPIALVDGEPATVGFAGLWPGSIGVYGITFTVPSDASTGDKFLDISLPDSYTTEAQIPIGITFTTQSAEPRAVGSASPPIPAILRRFPDRP